MDIPQLGLGNGLIPSRQMSGDSTTIPLQVRAMMAKRKESTPSVPKINMAEELKAIAAGKKGGYTQKERDSAAATFDHAAYLKHIDELGYEVVKKKSQ